MDSLNIMSRLLSSFTDGNSVKRFTFNFTISIYGFGQDSQDMDTVAYKSSSKFTPKFTAHYQILIIYFYSKVNTKADNTSVLCALSPAITHLVSVSHAPMK